MSKIAVDVVFLPPVELADLAIKLNRDLSSSGTNEIVLGNKEGEAMPHITLAMGCVEKSDLAEMGDLLEEIIFEYKVSELDAIGVYNKPPSKWTEITILNKEDLDNFRKAVWLGVTRFLITEAKGKTFFSHQESEETPPTWFLGFPGEKDFFPHITIGYGEDLKLETGVSFPIRFRPAKIAICHLGDYYTCRKVLWSKDLE